MGHFTVHNYSLSVVNSSSHSVIMSRNITARNATAYTWLFSIPHAGQTCSELEIKLTATNVIGESGVGTTTGGFPVSKLLSFNSWLPSLYMYLGCGERLYLITTDFLVHVHDLVARGVIPTSNSLVCTTDDQRLIREFKNISSHVITTDGLVMLTASN